MNNCLQCGTLTSNQKYCSHKCSSLSNPLNQPRKRYFCTKCDVFMGIGKSFNRKLCITCGSLLQKYDWYNITLGELKKSLPTSQVHARIRERARQAFNRVNQERKCKVCGYSKFIEVCHIKPVSAFPETTIISHINQLNNLIGLCPNCHWELDNGLLQI
jgi:hypothetical protein